MIRWSWHCDWPLGLWLSSDGSFGGENGKSYLVEGICGGIVHFNCYSRVLSIWSVVHPTLTCFSLVLAVSLNLPSSSLGLPVSTTLVAVGAIVAVGLFEGKEGVNWPVFLRVRL